MVARSKNYDMNSTTQITTGTCRKDLAQKNGSTCQVSESFNKIYLLKSWR